MMRGGALKRTTCGNWCHVVCAIALPEVFFEDKQRRDGINITKLNPARQKLVSSFSLILHLTPFYLNEISQHKPSKYQNAVCGVVTIK